VECAGVSSFGGSFFSSVIADFLLVVSIWAPCWVGSSNHSPMNHPPPSSSTIRCRQSQRLIFFTTSVFPRSVPGAPGYMSGINLTEVPSGTTAVKRDEDRACLGESRIGIRMRVSQIPFVSGNKKGSTSLWTLLVPAAGPDFVW